MTPLSNTIAAHRFFLSELYIIRDDSDDGWILKDLLFGSSFYTTSDDDSAVWKRLVEDGLVEEFDRCGRITEKGIREAIMKELENG